MEFSLLRFLYDPENCAAFLNFNYIKITLSERMFIVYALISSAMFMPISERRKQEKMRITRMCVDYETYQSSV